MGFFRNFFRIDIDAGVRAVSMDKKAVLVDVREPDEFAEGHIPGAVNLPLGELDRARRLWPDFDTPLYLYCETGARSAQAFRTLRIKGYGKVTNIGGIAAYTGPIEK